MNYPQGEAIQLFDVVDGGDGPAVVVGIAESADYAAGYQFEVTPRRDAGFLVVADNGSFKWRPLPGVPLLLCKRRQGDDENIANGKGHGPLPACALPPYHGFYVDGRRIELLDVVRIA